MKQQLEAIRAAALEAIATCANSGELEALRTGVADYKASFLKLINKYKTLLEGEKLLGE